MWEERVVRKCVKPCNFISNIFYINVLNICVFFILFFIKCFGKNKLPVETCYTRHKNIRSVNKVCHVTNVGFLLKLPIMSRTSRLPVSQAFHGGIRDSRVWTERSKDTQTVTDTGTAMLVCVCLGVYEGICVVVFVCSCF